MFGCLACIQACAPVCMPGAWAGQKRALCFPNYSYRWFRVTMLVLEVNPGSSGRAAGVLDHWANSPAHHPVDHWGSVTVLSWGGCVFLTLLLRLSSNTGFKWPFSAAYARMTDHEPWHPACISNQEMPCVQFSSEVVWPFENISIWILGLFFAWIMPLGFWRQLHWSIMFLLAVWTFW